MNRDNNHGYRWMETLLDELFAGLERSEALTLLSDDLERGRVMQHLSSGLEAAGMPAGLLASSEGQHLFIAVLTLRIKFQRQDAREKVALNIAMRERRA